jgi:dolichol-phosphate mannosyltransferase
VLQVGDLGTSISIIVPCYNEEAVIGMTHARLAALGEELRDTRGLATEIVYVDDGSRDRTLELLRGLRAPASAVTVIALSRNFGHQAAVSAGLAHAEGDAVAIIDADLQDPPELIPAMIDKWREGFEVVYAQRREREGESAFKLVTASMFYRLLNRLSDVEIPRDVGDFRLIDRVVVRALRQMPERARFLRGMVSWIGYRQYAMPYERAARAAGESKYPLAKMMRFALDGILSFSVVPLRMASYLGLLAACLAMLGIFYAVAMRVFTEVWVSGWTLLFIAVLFMGGVQLLVLGMLGEYLGRVYDQTKGRPLFIVDEVRTAAPDADATPAGPSPAQASWAHAS